MTTDEAIGAVGVGLLLLAFAGTTWGGLPPRARLAGAMNVVGASLSAYASYRIDYWPFVLLEGTWALVALEVLVRGPRQAERGHER